MDPIETIRKFPTRHVQGFNDPEIERLLALFPTVNRERFKDALLGCTLTTVNSDPVTYRIDIERALISGLDNRSIREHDWD